MQLSPAYAMSSPAQKAEGLTSKRCTLIALWTTCRMLGA